MLNCVDFPSTNKILKECYETCCLVCSDVKFDVFQTLQDFSVFQLGFITLKLDFSPKWK